MEKMKFEQHIMYLCLGLFLCMISEVDFIFQVVWALMVLSILIIEKIFIKYFDKLDKIEERKNATSK